MKILKKISLIIIGIILSLVVLEIGLQLAGFTLTTIKKYRNKITKDSNTITVLCLGESTTDKQWPPILQKILDENSKNKKFNVIDEGIVGINMDFILVKINENLIKYNPDIIISMIGINSKDRYLKHVKSKLKVVYLIKLIVRHLQKNYTYSNISILSTINDCNVLIKNGYIHEALIKFYKLFKKSNYKNAEIYSRLLQLSCYYDDSLCSKLLKINKININIVSLGIILRYLKNNNNFSNKQIQDYLIKNSYRILIVKRDYFMLKKILASYDALFLFDKLINSKKIYFIDKKTQEIKFFYEKDNNMYKYIRILEQIKKYNKNIIILPMQYPTLSIDNLKKDLKYSSYYDELIFISNEENFKQALQKYEQDKIFKDMFGGSFGHCTELGNTLIAENVAETILKLYN